MEIFYYMLAGAIVALLVRYFISNRIAYNLEAKQRLQIMVLPGHLAKIYLPTRSLEDYRLFGSGKILYFFEYLIKGQSNIDPIDYYGPEGTFKGMHFDKAWLQLHCVEIFKYLGPFVALVVDYNVINPGNLSVECVFVNKSDPNDYFDLNDYDADLKTIELSGGRVYSFKKYDIATGKAVDDNSDGVIYDKFSLILPK